MRRDRSTDVAATAWVALCDWKDVPREGGRYVMHENRAYAVFRVTEDGIETARVFDDHCPHAGASLAGGHVSDGCVVCPWHGWMFEIHSGQCPDNPAIAVRHYLARIENGTVMARLRL